MQNKQASLEVPVTSLSLNKFHFLGIQESGKFYFILNYNFTKWKIKSKRLLKNWM